MVIERLKVCGRDKKCEKRVYDESRREFLNWAASIWSQKLNKENAKTWDVYPSTLQEFEKEQQEKVS